MGVHPFLAGFRALLLDLNGTFMFGQDRFGPAEDYHATYRALGGRDLDAARLRAAVDGVVAEMECLVMEPARQGDFPRLAEALRAHKATSGLGSGELALIEQTVAAHEVGRVPAAHAGVLTALARGHRLGVVSNIFSAKDHYVAELGRVGLAELLSPLVFSSDGRAVKPAPAIFDRAIAALGLEVSEIVFVGDNPVADIAGARALAMATIWIDDGRFAMPASEVGADLVVSSLLDLAQA